MSGPDAPAPSGAVPATPEEPPKSKAQRRAEMWQETKLDLKWGTVLLLVLLLILPLALSPFGTVHWKSQPLGEENMSAVSDLLFTHQETAADGSTTYVDGDLVAPFEILSILLLAALIAGIVIAFRDREPEERA